MKKSFLLLILGGFLLILFFIKEKKPTLPLILNYNFRPGEERVYSISQTLVISFKNQNSPETFELNGNLIQRIYQLDKDKLIIGLKIENQDPDLGREIFVKVNPQGEIRSLLIPKNLPPPALNNFKKILTAFQIVLPENKFSENGSTYQLTEPNIHGPAQVEYKITYNKKINIEKSFLKYDFIGSNTESDIDIIFLPESKTNAIFEDGIPIKISQREKALINSAGIEIQTLLTTEIKLNEKRAFSLKSPFKIPSYQEVGIFDEGQDKIETNIKLRREIEGLKLEDIFEEFGRLNFKTEDQKAFSYFNKLKTFLKFHPDVVKKIINQVETLNPEDPFYENMLSVYFGAIATIPPKYAENPLMNIILRNPDPSIQIQAFGALGDLNHPTIKTLEFLIDYYKNPFIPESQSLAALSLGSLAYMAKNNSSILVKDTTNFLTGELKQAKRKEDILTLISAIGNTGNSNLLDLLITYQASNDKEIASTSVMALENMSGTRVENLINELLKNNSLKSSALYVLSKWPPSIKQLTLAKSFFELNKEPDLKIQSLNIISSNSNFFGKDVKNYLEKVKIKDPNPKIRNAALNLLISL